MATRIELRRPSARFEAEFISAARRSRPLHRHFAQPPHTRTAFRESLRRARRSTHEGHFLIERETGALVGVVNLMEIVRGSFQSAYRGGAAMTFLPAWARLRFEPQSSSDRCPRAAESLGVDGLFGMKPGIR